MAQRWQPLYGILTYTYIRTYAVTYFIHTYVHQYCTYVRTPTEPCISALPPRVSHSQKWSLQWCGKWLLHLWFVPMASACSPRASWQHEACTSVPYIHRYIGIYIHEQKYVYTHHLRLINNEYKVHWFDLWTQNTTPHLTCNTTPHLTCRNTSRTCYAKHNPGLVGSFLLPDAHTMHYLTLDRLFYHDGTFCLSCHHGHE